MDIPAEKAYPTPIANSPLLPLLLLSLATQRNSPRQSSSFKEEYDYIVVGGGSAGSVVASRLSEEPCVTVLLLEAGAKKPPLLNDVPGLGRFFLGTDIDWQFKTVPQKNTGFALVNKQVPWPRGKGLGGSSLLNAMIYIRGNRKDYDNWAAQGARGWSYKDVFPYFLKLEDNRNIDFLMNGYHASGGPVTVEKPGYQSEIETPILEAAEQLGYRVVDSNAARQTVPAENRTNLDIVGGAHVKKVLFDGSRAIGVQFDYKNSEYLVKARREIIMSAGTTNTAQLLMLSGIGPRKHLEKLKIPVIADLPVGNNLQDHCATFLPFVLNTRTMNEKLTDPRNIKEYINSRTGPLSSLNFISSIAFLGGEAEEDFPDHELYFGEVTKVMAKEQAGLKPIVLGPEGSNFENRYHRRTTMYVRLHVTTVRVNRICGAEVWRGRCRLTCSPRHLTTAQNYDFHPKISFVLLQNGT
ncbi:Glucose dehydrogenase [FAD, quinone] [Araneus ventricosus]|uniref:Glucose dehydrogenase [FAD, quinone] n=1 Tax=Araneus ventricosus TaxID=182803 RepID=A0A4Y2MKW9_ARAVE|nr:Glucose dehydrogenase [FAD, quinone] [Araneus ventricosus]